MHNVTRAYTSAITANFKRAQFNHTIAIGIYTAPLSGDVTHHHINSAAIYEAIAVVTNVR